MMHDFPYIEGPDGSLLPGEFVYVPDVLPEMPQGVTLIVPPIWSPDPAIPVEVKRLPPREYEDAIAALGGTNAGDACAALGLNWVVSCLRCYREVPGHRFEGEWSLLGGRTYRCQSGAVLILHPLATAYYCPDCSEEMRICRQCGCTDEVGCEGGCFWVAPDLCSSCSPGGTSRGSEEPLRRAA